MRTGGAWKLWIKQIMNRRRGEFIVYKISAKVIERGTPDRFAIVTDGDMEQEGRHDWQLTAVDFRTGLRVYSLKPSFTNEDFDDNVSSLVVGSTLGEESYGTKVFNNIWGTFSFGPQNSIYLGVYRGYIRFYSAPTLD